MFKFISNAVSDRRERGGLLLAAPSFTFLVTLFVIPSLLLIVASFWTFSNYKMMPTFVLTNYLDALSRPAVINSTLTALRIGFLAAVIATAASFPIAWYIAFKTRSNVLLYLVLLSWFSSYLVRIFAWRTILGTQGIINTALLSLGVISEPLTFLIFSPVAVIITLVHIFIPFTLLLLLSGLRNVTKDHIDACRDLGGTQFDVMRKVVFPIAYKGIIGSFLFTFILSAGDFITPQLVGGRSGMTVGFMISNEFRAIGDWPAGAAMAVMLIVIFLIVAAITVMIFRWLRLAPRQRFHPLLNPPLETRS